MSRMKNTTKIAAVIVGVVLAVGFGLVYGLFHGYFDVGKFDIKQVQWSSEKQAAMVVERSDQQALDGYTYFVLIGDHVFSPSELRHKYHSNAPAFAAADSCLDLHWQTPSKLVIACKGHDITPEHIDVERHEVGGIAILYDNIPNM